MGSVLRQQCHQQNWQLYWHGRRLMFGGMVVLIWNCLDLDTRLPLYDRIITYQPPVIAMSSCQAVCHFEMINVMFACLDIIIVPMVFYLFCAGFALLSKRCDKVSPQWNNKIDNAHSASRSLSCHMTGIIMLIWAESRMISKIIHF